MSGGKTLDALRHNQEDAYDDENEQGYVESAARGGVGFEDDLVELLPKWADMWRMLRFPFWFIHS